MMDPEKLSELMSVPDYCAQRPIARQTAYNHLAKRYHNGMIETGVAVDIDGVGLRVDPALFDRYWISRQKKGPHKGGPNQR